MISPSAQNCSSSSDGPLLDSSLGSQLKRCHSLLDPCPSIAKRRRASNYAQAPPSKRMRKAVSFSEKINKRVVIHSTEEEKKNSWYNRGEYREFREDMHATALSVRLGISSFIEPEDFCLRGLEANLSPDIAKLRKLRRQLLVDSILREQHAQRELGATNQEVIRELSTILSTDSQIDAVRRGASDSQV